MNDNHVRMPDEHGGRVRYERPQIVNLGLISAHTFMPITTGSSTSHKGSEHPNGDFEGELSHSAESAPGPGLYGNPHPPPGVGRH